MKTDTIRTFTAEQLQQMTTAEFDNLNVYELAKLRQTNPEMYHKLWKRSIAESKD